MTTSRLTDRVAVVTGASRGIGRAAAIGFAKAGAHVVAVARTQGGLEELDDEIAGFGGSTTLVPLDLKDGPGIDRLGAAIYERWGKLDILLGNAGLLGVITPVAHLDPKVFDEVMAVNVTANYRLIRALDPLLRQSDSGRALFLTSGAAQKCRPFWSIYSTSKAALEAIVRTYAAELTGTSATANLFSPGPLRTRMRAQAIPGEDPLTLEPPEAILDDMIRMVSPDFTDNGVSFSYVDKTHRSVVFAG